MLPLVLIGCSAWATAFKLAVASPGCGKRSPLPLGVLASGKVEVPGGAGPSGAALTRRYHIRLPRTYRADQKHPLLLFFHGWGGAAKIIAEKDDLGILANQEGWICIHAEGMADVSLWWGRGPEFTWGSWNGSGTVASPSPAGAICTADAGVTPCYVTCGRCRDHCWWTTCADDVAFVGRLLDHLETTLCIDSEHVVGSGFSNGAMFLYELAAHEIVSRRFSAMVPVAGLPHVGFNRPPASPLVLFGLWGRHDTEVPGFHLQSEGNIKTPHGATLSADGFFYTPLQQVIARWLRAANQRYSHLHKQYQTPFDGLHGLACMSSDAAARTGLQHFPAVVACTWDGGHAWPGYQYPLQKDEGQFPLASNLIAKVLLQRLRPQSLTLPLEHRNSAQASVGHPRFAYAPIGVPVLLSILALLFSAFAWYWKRTSRAHLYDMDACYHADAL